MYHIFYKHDCVAQKTCPFYTTCHILHITMDLRVAIFYQKMNEKVIRNHPLILLFFSIYTMQSILESAHEYSTKEFH